METLDSVLSRTGNPPIQRTAAIVTRHDQEDAYQASAGTRTRRPCASQGVCASAAARGIFSHKAWAEPAANSGFDVRMGQAAPRAIRSAQKIGANQRGKSCWWHPSGCGVNFRLWEDEPGQAGYVSPRHQECGCGFSSMILDTFPTA